MNTVTKLAAPKKKKKKRFKIHGSPLQLFRRTYDRHTKTIDENKLHPKKNKKMSKKWTIPVQKNS
jgi:hypothetical protein